MTDEEIDTANHYVTLKLIEANVHMGDGQAVIHYFVSNPLPSQATMGAYVETSRAERDQARIVKLRDELDKLERG